jgi:hypothetical protein
MSKRQWHVTGDAERATRVTHTPNLTCVECRRPWLNSAERWRVYLINVTSDMPPLTVPFCPACAMRLIGEL